MYEEGWRGAVSDAGSTVDDYNSIWLMYFDDRSHSIIIGQSLNKNRK
jgi:hypothetical protein